MSKQPSDWDDALVRAGLVDPRNGNPSRNQLAKRVSMSSAALNAIIDGRSNPRATTIQKVADALRVDVRVVAGWVGQERTERAPYAPPAEADLLTDRQRRAVDEIIRAIVAERASARDDTESPSDGINIIRGERPVPDRDDLADPAQPHGATTSRADIAFPEPRREDYERAAMTGATDLDRLDREADARGEGSQDPGSDEPV